MTTDFQQLNRRNLITYFEQGCKTKRTLGFELEHILLHKDTDAPVTYTEPGGIRDVLEAMVPAYREVIYDDNNIVGLVRSHETVSIEPAGQLEISAGPYETIAEIEAGYAAFRRVLHPILKDFNLYTPFVGYNPAACARDLELIPKRRYACMTDFLGGQAYSSICMMRGTASLQVSVDYESEHDALRKLRVAQKLAPILALMSDNVSVFEQHSVTGHVARTGVWSGMKQDRVGTIPSSLDPAFSFADYADYIMTREAVLVPDADAEGGWRYVADTTFDEVYAEREMTKEELEHALSMVWPDARLKYFVEVRPADAMPPQYAFAYTALIHALFYSEETMDALDHELADVDEEAIHAAKEALREAGYDAKAYGKPVYAWADMLIDSAREVGSDEDRAYIQPLADLVEQRRTLARSI